MAKGGEIAVSSSYSFSWTYHKCEHEPVLSSGLLVFAWCTSHLLSLLPASTMPRGGSAMRPATGTAASSATDDGLGTKDVPEPFHAQRKTHRGRSPIPLTGLSLYYITGITVSSQKLQTGADYRGIKSATTSARTQANKRLTRQPAPHSLYHRLATTAREFAALYAFRFLLSVRWPGIASSWSCPEGNSLASPLSI